MKLKKILEMQLGKNPKHEKTIKQREKTLEKKIVSKEKSKLKTLRKIEDLADELTLSDTKSFVNKYGKKIANEVQDFLSFTLKKLEDYVQDEKQFEIPMNVMPTMQGVVLNTLATNLNKIERKLVGEILKKEKPENADDFLKVLNMSSSEMYDKLGGKIPGLDVNELEEFVKKVSKDPQLKQKIKQLNKNINRLYSIYAKNKHLSSAGSSKKIEL